MDEADIYYIDTRNADPVVVSRGPATRTVNGRPVRVIHPQATAYGNRAMMANPYGGPYGSPYGNPYGQPGLASNLFGGMTGGQLIDLVAQIFAALMPLPSQPVATADAATDVGNLILYQSSLAQYAKRDEQVRTLGNLVTKLLG
jgi:hypothetical protein